MKNETDHPELGLIPGGDPILGAKLRIPASGTPALRRDRLFTRLSQGADGPLTLVCAPAGSGKTVLAGSWAVTGSPPGPVTWISLEPADDRSGVFWAYVLAGLSRSGVPVADIGSPGQPDVVPHSLLARLAARLSERAGPVVVRCWDWTRRRSNGWRLLRYASAWEARTT